MTRQFVDLQEFHADEFSYCVSIGPLELDDADRERWDNIGAAVAAGFELRGLFGVDAIRHDEMKQGRKSRKDMHRAGRVLVLLAVLVGYGAPAAVQGRQTGQTPLTTVYVNGDILTMNDAQPVVEALAVREGRILAAGTRQEVESMAGAGARTRRLGGSTLLPGFIDSHGHLSAVMSFMAFENAASPPVGEMRNISDILLPIHETAQRLGLLGRVQDYYAGYGITTVQEGAATVTDLQTLRKASERGLLKLDVVAYPCI